MERDWNRGTEVETEGLTERQRHKGREGLGQRQGQGHRQAQVQIQLQVHTQGYTDQTGIHGPDRDTITETGTEGRGTQVYLRPGSTCF